MCGTMELPVAAKVCPVCEGPVDRIWSANIATRVTVPRIHKVETLLDQASHYTDDDGRRVPRRATPSAEYQHQVADIKQQARQQAGRIRISHDEARALGSQERAAFQIPNPIFTGNSTMPIPKGQSPSSGREGMALPRVRPAPGSLMDGETMQTRRAR
jgi:hypothetical protein